MVASAFIAAGAVGVLGVAEDPGWHAAPGTAVTTPQDPGWHAAPAPSGPADSDPGWHVLGA
ncbi:hypothetical protein GCM10010393_11100 [Streptomyces gobitricini]|uniref:Uncharacterized protein n=1 Tax=Streptomyces gobitricini TaxID=68211 RepID=A0ABN3LGP4_9ACTN